MRSCHLPRLEEVRRATRMPTVMTEPPMGELLMPIFYDIKYFQQLPMHVVNTHTHTHAHAHARTHARTHTRAYTHTNSNTNTHTHTSMHTNTQKHTIKIEKQIKRKENIVKESDREVGREGLRT